MPVPMPAVVVLVFCKTVLNPGPVDQNASYTGYQDRSWAIEGGQMQCHRREIQLIDQAEANGADPQPFNQWRCNMAGLAMGAKFDHDHPRSPYRYFRSACPVPVIDTRTGDIIAWKIPDCGNGFGPGTMHCESDTAI